MESITESLSYIAVYSTLIPITCFLFSKANRSPILIGIFSLLALSFTADMVSEALALKGFESIIVSNLYTPLEFIAVTYIYSQMVPFLKYRAWYFIAGFLLLFLIDTLFIESLTSMQGYLMVVESLIGLYYGYRFVLRIMKYPPREPVLKHGPFWINTALFSYFTYCILIFCITNYMFKNLSRADGQLLWSVQNGINIAKNLLLVPAIWYCAARYRREAKSRHRVALSEEAFDVMDPNWRIKRFIETEWNVLTGRTPRNKFE